MTDARIAVRAAIDVGIFERGDDNTVESWVAELPREDVPAVLHKVEELRRALSTTEKMLASRIEADGILAPAEVVTIGEHDFMWAGDRHREITNTEALYNALHALAREGRIPVIAMRPLREAFVAQPRRAYLRELDTIARYSEEAAHVIRDFSNWREGPPKLRPLDDEGGTDQ